MDRVRLLYFLVAFTLLPNVCISQKINEDHVIRIGGLKQFIHVEGISQDLPLLLFLHGGPGGSAMGTYRKWTNTLSKHFLIVMWDQRETGKTLELNESPKPLSIQQFKDDTNQLVDSLLSIYHQQKLYLVGHSWGTVLGFYMAEHFPKKLHAYVAVGPMINQLESERIILRRMLENAERERNVNKLKELSSIKIPFQNGEQLYFHRKYLFEYVGNKRGLAKNFVLNWSRTWLSVFNEAASNNLFESLPQLNCPIYFFAGRNDVQTNSSITEAYYKAVIAPQKELIWFEKSAHGIPTTEPEKFQREIIKITK